MAKIAISAGHGLLVRGASGLIDEVDEARKVVETVANLLEDAIYFFDDTSETQDENLATLVEWHNSHARDLDVSVHFNAYEPTEKPMGTECLFLTADEMAASVSKAIAVVGFKNRGAKQRTDLYFLNNTNEPAILIEVCFVDSTADVDIYTEHFDAICRLIVLGLEQEGVA